jgi:predicted metal-dependent hydrolase
MPPRRLLRPRALAIGPERPLELVVPAGASDAFCDRVIAERRDWIARQLRRAEEARRLPGLGLSRAGALWIEGVPVPARLERRAQRGVRLRAGVLEAGPGDLERLLDAWYREQARGLLTAAVERESPRLGVRHGRIVVRDARTRWASCSRSGTLSFSWRLAVAPPDVLAYVVVHELCHLVELNHSRRFWALVEQALPGWRDQRAWLRRHGAELAGYRPAAAFT